MKIGLFVYCTDLKKDRVAKYVYDKIMELYKPAKTEYLIDEKSIYCNVDEKGNHYYHIQTDEVMSHDYPKYIPLLMDIFPNADIVAIVNWHEGANAPDNILTVHSNGDVISGEYGMISPEYMRNLLIWMNRIRIEEGLKQFTVMTEATHWAGTVYNKPRSWIKRWEVPIVDYEIGSSIDAWTNEKAAIIMAKAIVHVFDDLGQFYSILCIGGMHFTDVYGNAVTLDDKEKPIAISHILTTRWIEEGNYLNEDGMDKYLKCIDSIIGNIDGIVIHKKLQSQYKQVIIELANKLNIPTFTHKQLKNLANVSFKKKKQEEKFIQNNHTSYLFILNSNFKNQIQKANVNPELINEFRVKQIDLADNAKISTLNPKKWKISDDKNEYLIKEKKGELLVYPN